MKHKPYICRVIKELQRLGYEGENAEKVFLKQYRVSRRTLGFYLNATDLAREIADIENAAKQKYDPNDPTHIYIGHLKARIKANRCQNGYPKN